MTKQIPDYQQAPPPAPRFYRNPTPPEVQQSLNRARNYAMLTRYTTWDPECPVEEALDGLDNVVLYLPPEAEYREAT